MSGYFWVLKSVSVLKSSLRFSKKTHEFVNDNVTCSIFKSYYTTHLYFKIKLINMLQEPVKLLKKEKVVLPYYRLPPVEGFTIYTHVMLVLNGFPA